MRVADMNWMQLEAWLRRDDRCVLPMGSTEQHAYLSLATDNILAERIAVEAAAPSGVPVFPTLTYGITPAFRFGFIDWRSYYAGVEQAEHSDWLPGIVSGFRAGVNYHPKADMKSWEVGGYLEGSVTFAADESGDTSVNHGDNGPQSYVTFFGGIRTSLQF